MTRSLVGNALHRGAAPESPRSLLPRRFRSKNGDSIELERLPAESGRRLIEMYLAYQPRGSFQGLPPFKDEVCVKWVREMLATGVHVVAIDQRACLIGHTGLFPINPRKCEMLVVVCPDYQNLGIGTQLVRSCIELAGELGFERIWLPVDATNVRARHIYRKCGFEYVSKNQGRELDMVCNLRPAGQANPVVPLVPTAVFQCPSAPIAN